MDTLQQKLRQLRSWQSLTLAQAGEKSGLGTKHLAAIEGEGRRWPGDAIENNKALFIALAHAYGVVPKCLERLLEEEYAWRVSVRSATYSERLPRMSRYLYRPLTDAAHNLFQDGFVVLDCETTGRDPHSQTEICEISILDTDGVVLLNTLVKPSAPIPAETTAIHGITNEMVAGAPTFREIYPRIKKAIQGQVVCIYNANYDAYLLDRLCIESGLDIPHFEQWCLMEAYKLHIKNERWVKLTEACVREDVELDGEAHRSLADTTSTWRLLQKLALQYNQKKEVSRD